MPTMSVLAPVINGSTMLRSAVEPSHLNHVRIKTGCSTIDLALASNLNGGEVVSIAGEVASEKNVVGAQDNTIRP